MVSLRVWKVWLGSSGLVVGERERDSARIVEQGWVTSMGDGWGVDEEGMRLRLIEKGGWLVARCRS